MKKVHWLLMFGASLLTFFRRFRLISSLLIKHLNKGKIPCLIALSWIEKRRRASLWLQKKKYDIFSYFNVSIERTLSVPSTAVNPCNGSQLGSYIIRAN